MNAAELIATVERLAKAATPGPWKAGRPDMATIVDGYDSKWVYAGEQYCAVASGRIEGEWAEVVANAAFIAAMRTHAPALARALKLAIKQRDYALGEIQCSVDEFKSRRAKANAALDAVIQEKT